MTVPNSLTYEELLLKASQIVNECQAGNVSATLNITGSCQSVTVPPVNLGETEVTYSTPSPDRLIFHAAPQASYEGKPLQIQPVVHAVDIGVSNSSLLSHKILHLSKLLVVAVNKYVSYDWIY